MLLLVLVLFRNHVVVSTGFTLEIMLLLVLVLL